jgi:hypothetical protein
VDSTTNGCGIEGAWYWYSDMAGTTVADAVANMAPYRAGSGMCIRGSTIVDATFAAYGAAIGLDLNYNGTQPLAYNATAAGVQGFRVTIGGSFTQPLRFAFVMDPNTTLPSPFVTLPGTGTHEVLISNAVVPSTWDVANAGQTVNPVAITGVQIQVVGAEVAGPFDLCVTSLSPLTAP